MYDVSFRNFAEGEVVRGVVLRVSESEVIVDVGYKSEGMIALEEFRDENGEISVKTGDSVDVLIEKTENRDGYVVLSKEKAEKMKVWDEVERAYQERRVVTGRVIERVKGGLAVDIGVRAFLPGSQVDMRPVRNLDALRGAGAPDAGDQGQQEARQHRALPQGRPRRGERREEAATPWRPSRRARSSTASSRTSPSTGPSWTSAGIDGLLHITDMSWGRINHPTEVLNVGDEIRVVVLKFDRESERVSLGMKQLQADPWTTATIKYPVGARVKGQVVSLTDYGAFVELEQGVEGLIHVSEMSWSKKVKHPSKILAVNQEVECQVLGIDQEAHRISLGLKQVETNPWEQLAEKYPIGAKITGKVRNLTEFGAFVEVEEGIDGLIHISDLSWTKRVKHPSEVLKKGDDGRGGRPQHRRREPAALPRAQAARQPTSGRTSSPATRSATSSRARSCASRPSAPSSSWRRASRAWCTSPSWTRSASSSPEEQFKPGDAFPMKIIKVQEGDRKIGLSIKAVKADEFQKDFQAYRESSGSDRSTIGDILRAQQEAAAAREKEAEE